MTKTNPILEELRQTRERLLAEAGGTLDGLVEKLQTAEKESGRIVLPPPTKQRQPASKAPVVGGPASTPDAPLVNNRQ